MPSTRGGPIPPKTEIVNRESRFQESGIGNLTTSTTVVRFSQKTGIVNRESRFQESGIQLNHLYTSGLIPTKTGIVNRDRLTSMPYRPSHQWSLACPSLICVAYKYDRPLSLSLSLLRVLGPRKFLECQEDEFLSVSM